MRIIEESYLQQFSEFDGHVRVVELNDEAVGLKGYIAIHRQHMGVSSLGATRVWQYAAKDEALCDALRLSKLMSYKSVLAGLPYGGAKAVLILPDGGIKDREKFFEAYGREVNRLEGEFVTGTDVGLLNEDLKSIQKATEFVIGHGVNSGYYTSQAVFQCINVVVQHLFPNKKIKDLSFAVQGLGKTGVELVALLVGAGVTKIFACEINKNVLDKVKAAFPLLKIVPVESILDQEVDILCPCALGGVIDKDAVPSLKCKAIVGPANNQLSSPDVGHMLSDRGIFYAPDYLVNAGGLISVVDQYIHKIASEVRISKVLVKISENLEKIIKQSMQTSRPSSVISDELAEELLRFKV